MNFQSKILNLYLLFSFALKQREEYLFRINQFLQEQLSLQIHPEKSGILLLDRGIPFLGFRIFYHHKLIRRKNILKFWQKYQQLKENDTLKEIKSRIYYQTINYDEINCVLADIKWRKRKCTSSSR